MLARVGTVFVLHCYCVKSILVIDDDDEVRSVVVTTLTQAGYSVREAIEGRAGIQMILAEKPDLIVCDVRMPSMDGLRTLSAIRKFPGTAAIPLILMSGSDSVDREGFRRGMASGADDFLLKPFTPSELIEAVESRLTRKKEFETEAWKKHDKNAITQLSQGQPAAVNGVWEAIPFIRKRLRV